MKGIRKYSVEVVMYCGVRRITGMWMLAFALLALLGCSAGDTKPKETLDKLLYAARNNDEAGMDANIAKGSMLDTKGFLETRESLSTDELTRRIKLRALTDVFLARIESYTVDAERDIDRNTKELVVTANVSSLSGPAEKARCRFRFVRQGGKWKFDDWQFAGESSGDK